MGKGIIPGGRTRPSLAARPPTDDEITSARRAVASRVVASVEGKLSQIHACAELLDMLGLLPSQLGELRAARASIYNSNRKACAPRPPRG